MDVGLVVDGSAKPCGDRTQKGHPALRGTYRSITGRKYCFIQQDAPKFMADKGMMASFSPTQMKNYPIQGFSTGDVVPHMIGVLSNRIYGSILNGRLIPINTIHDSILFDCQVDVVDQSCKAIKYNLERTPKEIASYFKMKFDLPLKVDIEVGLNWGDMKKWSI